MREFYKDKIKVVGVDLLCFAADPETLEALSYGCYDPYAWKDLEKGPVETIGINEWQTRVNERRKTP